MILGLALFVAAGGALGTGAIGGGSGHALVCGDGYVSAGEGCDDGNTTNGDGCSSTCTVEAGYFCRRGSPSYCYPAGALYFIDGDDLDGAYADKASITSWDSTTGRLLPVTVDAAHEPLVEKNALNGHTAAHLDGCANTLKYEKSATTLAPLTDSLTFDAFFVARWNGNGNGASSFYWLSNSQAATSRGLALLIKSTRATSGFVSKGDGTYHVNTIAAPTTGTLSAAKWHLLEIHGDATSWKTSIDGGADEATVFANALTTGELAGDLILGTNAPTTNAFYDVTIAHSIIYARDLTSGERTNIRAALAKKYGTFPVAPAKRIAFLGDSITFGGHVNIPYPARAESDGNANNHGNVATGNFGINGDTTSGMASRWTNNIRGQGYTAIVLEGCVNDLANAADTTLAQTTAEQGCETNFNTIVSQATTDGMSVVLITLTPWASYAGSSVNRQTATTTFVAFVKGLDNGTTIRVYDANSDASLGSGSPSSLLPANDSGDHLHPSQAGSDIIAAAVEPLLGL